MKMQIRGGEIYLENINVKDGVSIGANSTIFKGVTIGRGYVIASNSVVTKDCLPKNTHEVVPAKNIKTLS